jgi:hypothetical protein
MSTHLRTEREQLAELKRLGFVRSLWVSWGAASLVVLVALLAVVGPVVLRLPRQIFQDVTGKDFATLVFAVGGFVVTFHQWRAARREASLERFYDRLDRVNHHLRDCEAARSVLRPDFANREFYERAFLAFTELDNLEYAIEKFRAGYMSTRNAHRAADTFRSRCAGSAEFQWFAYRCVHDYGYSDTTRRVVDSVLEDLPSSVRADYRSSLAPVGQSVRSPVSAHSVPDAAITMSVPARTRELVR